MNPPVDTATTTNTVKVWSNDEIKEADKHKKKVLTELGKAEKAFTQVACELAWLRENDRFKALDSAMNFEQFAQEHFNFKKTQAYALVGLVERFGQRSLDGVYSIADKYTAYGHTKLIQLVNLSDEQIKNNFNPKMTVKEIKELVKKLTPVQTVIEEKTVEQDADIEEKTAEQDADNVNESDDDVIDVDAKINNSQALMTFSNYEDFEEHSAELFSRVAQVFKANPNYKISISYEW